MVSSLVDGPLGRFLGFWGVFRIAAFSIGGPEFVCNSPSAPTLAYMGIGLYVCRRGREPKENDTQSHSVRT